MVANPALTGTRIRALREALRLDLVQFATLLGVAESSVRRWEARREEAPDIDHSAARILLVLVDQVDRRQTAEERAELQSTIAKALLIGGGLFALFLLLKAVFGDDNTPAAGN